MYKVILNMSIEGACLEAKHCFPTNEEGSKRAVRSKAKLRVMQKEWLAKFYPYVFLSDDRLYTLLIIGNVLRIIDAVTGSIFTEHGKLLGAGNLTVDIHNTNTDPTDIWNYIEKKY